MVIGRSVRMGFQARRSAKLLDSGLAKLMAAHVDVILTYWSRNCS